VTNRKQISQLKAYMSIYSPWNVCRPLCVQSGPQRTWVRKRLETTATRIPLFLSTTPLVRKNKHTADAPQLVKKCPALNDSCCHALSS